MNLAAQGSVHRVQPYHLPHGTLCPIPASSLAYKSRATVRLSARRGWPLRAAAADCYPGRDHGGSGSWTPPPRKPRPTDQQPQEPDDDSRRSNYLSAVFTVWCCGVAALTVYLCAGVIQACFEAMMTSLFELMIAFLQLFSFLFLWPIHMMVVSMQVCVYIVLLPILLPLHIVYWVICWPFILFGVAPPLIMPSLGGVGGFPGGAFSSSSRSLYKNEWDWDMAAFSASMDKAKTYIAGSVVGAGIGLAVCVSNKCSDNATAMGGLVGFWCGALTVGLFHTCAGILNKSQDGTVTSGQTAPAPA